MIHLLTPYSLDYRCCVKNLILPPAGAKDFIVALMNSGYLMYVVKAVEVVGGILLLANIYVPLALVIIAPITLNIFLFHLFLAMDGLPIAVVLLAMNVYLGYVNRSAFANMLKK
jgi:putative oxidoreductase